MEWYTIISLLFGGMVFLLLTGIPIAFAFLIVNLVAAYFFLAEYPASLRAVTGVFTSITTFTLLPVPSSFYGELIFTQAWDSTPSMCSTSGSANSEAGFQSSP